MTLFKKIFSKSKNNSQTKGISLTTENQIEEIINLSVQNPVLIFKHSTRCGISGMVLRRFENRLSNSETMYNYFLLDVLQFRNISMLVQDKFQAIHQSPQLLIIKNGELISHSSHDAILNENL